MSDVITLRADGAGNLAAAGRTDVGARLLQPGESLRAAIALAPEL